MLEKQKDIVQTSFLFPQRKAKKALNKKKLFTPDEKTKIAEEFKLMKSVLLDKSGKNGKETKGLSSYSFQKFKRLIDAFLARKFLA